jgi:hypothetical protein
MLFTYFKHNRNGGNQMDIAALSMAMSQFNVSTAVNTSLMKKALNDGTENAAQMIQSINQASNTNVGTKLDVMA